MEVNEEVLVLNSLLMDRRFDDFFPDFLVVPLQVVKFLSETSQHTLMVDYFRVPLLKDDLLELAVKLLAHVVSVELAIISEGNHQPYDVLNMQAL